MLFTLGGYMDNRSLLTIVLAILLLGTVVTAADAQSTNRFEVEIPFQFVVDGRPFAPGNYGVERVDAGRPSILKLKNLDTGLVRAIFCHRVEKETPSTTSFLLFTHREGKFFLSQIWDHGSSNGNEVPLNRKDSRYKQQDMKPLVVKARDNGYRP